jgi:hypothetical protein
MKLDDAVLEELTRAGEGTVKQISERLSGRVYEAVQRLIKSNHVVVKHGYPGKGNEKVYSLPPIGPIKRRKIASDET